MSNILIVFSCVIYLFSLTSCFIFIAEWKPKHEALAAFLSLIPGFNTLLIAIFYCYCNTSVIDFLGDFLTGAKFRDRRLDSHSENGYNRPIETTKPNDGE